MMTKLAASALVGLQLFATGAWACTAEDGNGIFPKNDVKVPVSRWTLATDKAEFDKAVVRLQKLYEGAFTKQGRVLEIRTAWSAEDQVVVGGEVMTGDTVNAFATREGNVSVVQMFGGLFRHPLVTNDAFHLVICHELGHHLGGAPKRKALFWDTWASNEGQSDYFATLKCSRELWKGDDNAKVVSTMNVPAAVTSACQKQFDSANEIALCQRAAMAGKSLADTLGSLPEDEANRVTTDFEKPDRTEVSVTNDRHPKAQCRLDTYLAGAICPKSKDAALSEKNATVGTCSEEKSDPIGFRPRCWYKPGTATFL